MRWTWLLPLASGCDQSSSPLDDRTSGEPIVSSARIACEGPIDQEEWVFQATVTDPDGLEDLADITAFVYDEVTEEPQGSVPLLLLDGDFWESRVPAAESGLECGYQRYSADFVAVDLAGNSGTFTAFVDPLAGG